jgi:hypothetical protein
MAFVVLEDEIQANILIDDLAAIAPIADKAFRIDLDSEPWRLWYNRSLDAINIQRESEFFQQKPTRKVGIHKTANGLSYYYENKPVNGIPSELFQNIQNISGAVRMAKKVYDKGDSFDPESLRLIFDFMKLKNMVAESPLILDVVDDEKYSLWLKRADPAAFPPTRTRGMAATPQTRFYLNFQSLVNFKRSVQEGKLGLGLDGEGHVRSVMTDGQTRPLELVDALLFDADGEWNRRLTRILQRFLIDHGVRAPDPGAARFRIHAHAIAKAPEHVARLWVRFTQYIYLYINLNLNINTLFTRRPNYSFF